MGNRHANRADGSFENESISISAFIQLDGSSNVIGFKPTLTPPTLVGPYTRAIGMQISLGPAGAVVTQPHTGTGVYQFTLDEAWQGATEAWVQMSDQGAVAQLNYSISVNTLANQLGGANPGNDPTIPPQTAKVQFRNASTGALTNPPANIYFWLGMKLRRSGGYF